MFILKISLQFFFNYCYNNLIETLKVCFLDSKIYSVV